MVREDDASSMTITSTNGSADWWKVKVERNLSIEEGKTYEVTFRFTSNASGRIKYSVNGATYLSENEYDVKSGSNTLTVRFVAGAEKYSCLELGGLGVFKLTFTSISVKEVEDSIEPEQPENTEQPENPELPENTEQPENPELPESTEQPENSGQKDHEELTE